MFKIIYLSTDKTTTVEIGEHHTNIGVSKLKKGEFATASPKHPTFPTSNIPLSQTEYLATSNSTNQTEGLSLLDVKSLSTEAVPRNELSRKVATLRAFNDRNTNHIADTPDQGFSTQRYEHIQSILHLTTPSQNTTQSKAEDGTTKIDEIQGKF